MNTQDKSQRIEVAVPTAPLNPMEEVQGSSQLVVSHELDGLVPVDVSQLKLRQYEAGFKLMDDEMGIVALATGKTKEWVMDVLPESYEQLRDNVWRVNEKGFFAYANRRNKLTTERLNAMRPEVVRLAAEAAMASASRSSQPGLLPRRA